MFQSSNPALHNDDAFSEYYGKDMFAGKADVTTLGGVANKTAMLVTIAVAGGFGGYWLIGQIPGMPVMMISCIAALIAGIGVAIVLARKPKLAKALAPVYAVIEGVFLGALSGTLDTWLSQMGKAAAGGVALQAFVITIGIMASMLLLYKMRILQPTKRFVSVVSVMAVGIFMIYGLSFVLAIFGVQLPFISLGSTLAGGTTAWIALGINVLILGVASLMLIIDFGLVEEHVNAGAPKHMEWYLGFALLVTLAWIYYEAVKLVFRLSVMFGGDD